MLFLPVTRQWSIEPVMAALNASDIPREVLLLIDAPGCEGWFEAFVDAGWSITMLDTHNTYPPEGREERRARHLTMRRLSQTLLRQYPEDRILCVEDDTLVPPDVWTRLSSLLDRGYEVAVGLQYSRWESRVPGIWYHDSDLGIFDPLWAHEGVHEADACGHYCLMTTGEAYGRYFLMPDPHEPIDIAHTKHLKPIAADYDCRCGHLCENGVIW